MSKASGSIDLKSVDAAAKTATNYMEFDSTNGLRISQARDYTKPYVQIIDTGINIIKDSTHKTTIDSSGMQFYVGDSTNSVASFSGTGIQIGKSSEFHMNLDGDSLDFTDGVSSFSIEAYTTDNRRGGSFVAKSGTLAASFSPTTYNTFCYSYIRATGAKLKSTITLEGSDDALANAGIGISVVSGTETNYMAMFSDHTHFEQPIETPNLPGQIVYGEDQVTVNASSNTTLTINFAGYSDISFDSAPTVVFVPYNASITTHQCTMWLKSVTTTKCTIYIKNDGSASRTFTIHWIAMG